MNRDDAQSLLQHAGWKQATEHWQSELIDGRDRLLALALISPDPAVRAQAHKIDALQHVMEYVEEQAQEGEPGD